MPPTEIRLWEHGPTLRPKRTYSTELFITMAQKEEKEYFVDIIFFSFQFLLLDLRDGWSW